MSKVMAVAAMLAAILVAGRAGAADKLVLQLHAPAQFEFAGYYAALWQGFYSGAGLTVVIKPGTGRGETPIDPVREVTEGRAQFGTGTAELVVRTAQGQPLVLLAPIFQQSGAGVYYRSDADFPSPAALAGATVGRLPASNIYDIELATALRSEGIDSAKLKSVPLQPDQNVDALADHRVDAVPGSAWEVPWRAHEKGFEVKSFNPADYRVEFYGDTLFTLRHLATTEPDTVRRFRAASLKGWEYALQHADEIAARMLAELPPPPGIADPAGLSRYQAELAGLLARYPAVSLGHSNPDRWRRIEASMLAVGALLRTAEIGDVVYDPDGAARSRNDLRAFGMLGAALLIGIAVLAWLWLRRARRAVIPATAAADQPVAAALPPPTAAAPAAATVGPSPRRQPPADLNAVLARLEQTIRHRLPRRVAFRTSLLPELWTCHTEASTVRTLVLDLVDAAAADLKGTGDLVVGTRNYAFTEANLAAAPGARLGEYVRITVRDSGPGLSEAGLDRVFDPAATPRPSAALASETMRILGGFARVESAEGVGTAVHLYFPRAADATAAQGVAAKPAAAAE